MPQYLPTGGFRWLTEKEINKIDLAKYKEDSRKGVILEVDMEYPQELRDLHNDYPLTPEKMKVTQEMLSPYFKSIREKFNISTGQVHKLIPTLIKKENVLHYRNLQPYTDRGLKVKKVHRVLEFNQWLWLKQYVDFNTQKRTKAKAKNSYEKDFFKLMNNSVKLVTDERKLMKLTSKPTFVTGKIFHEKLVEIKETLTPNRPRRGGGGNAIYVPYGDVPPIRVSFLAFESETGCLFSSLTLKQGAKFVGSIRARVLIHSTVWHPHAGFNSFVFCSGN